MLDTKELVETEIIDVTTTEEVRTEKWSQLYSSKQAIGILSSLEQTCCNCGQTAHTCPTNNNRDSNNNITNSHNSSNSNKNNSNNSRSNSNNSYNNGNNSYSKNIHSNSTTSNSNRNNSHYNSSNNRNSNNSHTNSNLNQLDNNQHHHSHSNSSNSTIVDNNLKTLGAIYEDNNHVSPDYENTTQTSDSSRSMQSTNNNERYTETEPQEVLPQDDGIDSTASCEESLSEIIRQLLVIGKPSPVPPQPRKHTRTDNQSKSLRWKRRSARRAERAGGKTAGRSGSSCRIFGCPFCKSHPQLKGEDGQSSIRKTTIRRVTANEEKVAYRISPLPEKHYYTVRSKFRSFRIADGAYGDDHVGLTAFHGNDDSEDSGVSVSDDTMAASVACETTNSNGRNEKSVGNEKNYLTSETTFPNKKFAIGTEQERTCSDDREKQVNEGRIVQKIYIEDIEHNIFIVGPKKPAAVDNRTRLTESGFFEDLDAQMTSDDRKQGGNISSPVPVNTHAQIRDSLSNKPFKLKIK